MASSPILPTQVCCVHAYLCERRTFCIVDFHMIIDLLYIMTMPDVDLCQWDKLLPQSVSAYPDSRSIICVPLQYLILKLRCEARYFMR